MNQATLDCSSSDDDATEQTKLMAAHNQDERYEWPSVPVVVTIQPSLPQAKSDTEDTTTCDHVHSDAEPRRLQHTENHDGVSTAC